MYLVKPDSVCVRICVCDTINEDRTAAFKDIEPEDLTETTRAQVLQLEWLHCWCSKFNHKYVKRGLAPVYLV